MLVLCLAIAIAIAGLYLAGGNSRGALAQAVFHLGIVVSISLVLAFTVVPWLMGAWFAALAGIYAGHAFAVRYWGSPMTRSVFLLGLLRFPQFARTKPRLTLALCPSLALLCTVGWAAARFDLPASSKARTALYLAGASVLLGGAAVAWQTARVSVYSDLLLALILGGDGNMSGLMPVDPALGRRQPSPALEPRRATIILFVVDSLRPRNMSAFGYGRHTTPFLKALLVEQSARAVPLAVTSCPTTESAYWSIFSSRRTRHQAVNAPCLHDLLRASGFTVRFLLSGVHREWMSLRCLYGTNHDAFIDCLVDDQLLAEAKKLPAPSASGDFLVFHLMSAHMASGCEPPPVWKPARNRFAWFDTADPDAAAREAILNHYDNSVLQADNCIARIMEVLRQKGFLDNAVVVVTGDHGETIGERNPVTIGHGLGLYQESIHIPLILWDSTRTLPEPAFLADQTDIAPTILESVGIEPPSAWQGSSIFAPPRRQTAHVEHVAHRPGTPPTHMEALLALLPCGTFKIMLYRQAGREILRKAFCLSADPGEKEDLKGRLVPEVAAGLENALREYHDEPALALSTTWRFLGRAV